MKDNVYDPINPYNTRSGSVSNNCYAYAMNSFRTGRPHKAQPGGRAMGYIKTFTNQGMTNAIKYLLKRAPLDKHGFLTFTRCKWYPLVIADAMLPVNRNKVFKVRRSSPTRKGFYRVCSLSSKEGDFHWLRQHTKLFHYPVFGQTREDIAKIYNTSLSRVGPIYTMKGPIPVDRCIVKRKVWSHKQGWGGPTLIVDAKGNLITDPFKADFKYPGLHYDKICSFYDVKNQGVVVGPELRSDTNVFRVMKRIQGA